MNKGLVYSTRSYTGREGDGILHHFLILKTNSDSIDILTELKTGRNMQMMPFSVDDAIRHISIFYKERGIHMENWEEFYEKVDIERLKRYDDFYLMGGLDFWRSNLTRRSKRVDVFPKDKGQLKFQSTGVKLANILAMLKAHNECGIRLHELAYDPNEMALSKFHVDFAPKNEYYCYHGYDIPKYNIIRLDSSQYAFSKERKLFKSNKIYDFTFGFTALKGSGREKWIKYVDKISKKFPKSNVFIQTDDVNTTVDRKTYLDLLEASRYTLMLPSYDEYCFSIYRFIEAIANDCLPIFPFGMHISDVESSFQINLKNLFLFEHMNLQQMDEIREYELNRLKKVFLTPEHFFRKSG